MRRVRSLSLKKKILLGAVLIVVAFFTWLIIRLITMDTSLNVINLYEIPKLVSLKNPYTLDVGDYAVAVDGKIVAGKSYEAEETNVLPTASTAKMILALAVMQQKPFELGETGETITISQEDYNRYAWYYNNGGSTVAVQVGEEISQYDALAATLMASANNLADTLAEWAFGSLDNYREYATNMLRERGIVDTVIGEDASGFSDTTKSTATDLARIGKLVLENPVLAKIVGTKESIVPVAGTIHNTNQLLGTDGIIGVKTGYIGDVSGYCLVSGYKEGEHIITTALLGAATRTESFNESLSITRRMQELTKISELVKAGEVVGYYDSWWNGTVEITADESLSELSWAEAETATNLIMDGETGILEIAVDGNEYEVAVRAGEYSSKPTLIEKIKHIFGWEKEKTEIIVDNKNDDKVEEDVSKEEVEAQEPEEEKKEIEEVEKKEEAKKAEEEVFTNAKSNNCTIKFGALMLINPNFTVEESFINTRRGEMVSLSARYGIVEGNPGNGDNILDAEAAVHINDMVNAYKAAYPGHTLETRSCFRSRGTNCGRLCAATGASDHHTGLTCDLLDPAYGTSLDTDTYAQHIDWQWLRANSYKYGFIDRFPEAWAGGPMSEPLNVDANGSTGLYETWHYRYVGIPAATEIATGKYNNGQYDSLEHYLKARGMITNLKNGKCK